MKLEKSTLSQLDAWDYMYKIQVPRLKLYAHSSWFEGFKIIEPYVKALPRVENIPTLNWTLLPIDGKSSDEVFFDRLSRGIHNINMYKRDLSEVEYLPTRDFWHDIIGHLPTMSNSIVDNFIRGLGVLYRAKPELIHEIANLYWWTIEFGLVLEEVTDVIAVDHIRQITVVKALGAGVISSINELETAVIDQKSKIIPVNSVDQLMKTNYDPYGVQNQHFLLPNLEYLNDLLIQAWKITI